MDSTDKLVLKMVGVVILIAVGVAMLSAKLSKSALESECLVFSVESGRVTKMVEYGYGQYDCLTPTEDGKWISTANLREET